MNSTFQTEGAIPKLRLQKLLLIILVFFNSIQTLKAQNAFSGMLEYKITARDTSLRKMLPDNLMLIYTNDTLLRMENFTGQFGEQVTIKHIPKNKSYLLLETKLGKFAIQTDHSLSDTVKTESLYTFKKKHGKRKLLGIKVNRILVMHPEFTEPIEFWFNKKISNKYLNPFKDIPGLPVKYSIPTADGVLDYELVKINPYSPNIDLFGIPSEYERLSFDAFLDKMLAPENETIISPD